MDEKNQPVQDSIKSTVQNKKLKKSGISTKNPDTKIMENINNSAKTESNKLNNIHTNNIKRNIDNNVYDKKNTKITMF